MDNFITMGTLIKNLNEVSKGIEDMRVMSIGSTSDGRLTFRCKDNGGNEKVVYVSCYEG